MNKTLYTILMALLAAIAPSAYAFTLDTYAEQSRLSSGRWVKISVPATGVYQITPAQLKQWGFSNPQRVRIYGYGGSRINNVLVPEFYIDDLPLVQSQATDRGIVFYGVGPEGWVQSNSGVYINNSNIYTTCGYYFLTESDEAARPIEVQGLDHVQPTDTVATMYRHRQHYEYDRVSPGESGFLLVGESFRTQSTRKFKFDLPAAGDTAALECGIVSNSEVSGTVSFMVNGAKLEANSSDRIAANTMSGYNHGLLTVSSHGFPFSGNSIEVSVSVSNVSSMLDCWLDYLAVTAWLPIKMPASGVLDFRAGVPAVALADAGADAQVWDVTHPLDITRMASASAWTNDYHGERDYVAWSASAALPQPTYVGTVANQDLHSQQGVDMVIFTQPEFMAQANRIAQLHSTAAKPLSVAVLNVEQVYNEFASGAPDISALRKCLKMIYDRSVAADSASALRYALLIGRATYDHRQLTSQYDSHKGSRRFMPCWMGGERRGQLSDNSAFGTDDFIAMLGDGSGVNMGLDDLTIAVGRMPVRTVEEAKSAVDKLAQYMQKSKMGTWRNSFLFLADDGDNGVHVKQTEEMIDEMLSYDKGHNFISKVYVDAYDIVAGSCEGGRQDMYRMLDEGVVWWNFSGHANNHSWTGENMLNYSDINNMYLQRVPVLLAATCDFLRWDSNTLSGGEILYHERYGGAIAMISATRPVYITDNGYFTRAVGRAINKRNEQGERPRLGDIYRMAKNNILNEEGQHRSNTNRLRYVLMGDPALQLGTPDNIVRLDSIGQEEVQFASQVTLKALERSVLRGSVVTPQGELIEDFNGTVEVVIYDAEQSRTTKGIRDENVKRTFEVHGEKLFAGSAPVANGRFALDVAMPAEIAGNFRPATINMFAYSSEKPLEAAGLNSDFYVYGFDDEAPADTEAPVIETMVLNHPTFKPGDKVNSSPMLIADIRDDVGINLSTAGVGHQMTLTLDDTRTYTNVALYYTPAADGSAGGSICYPIDNLTNGPHTLRLRVWDTSGNSANQEIDFVVEQNLVPTIFDIYTDANPASTEANFYLSHDRPDAHLSVTVTVYDLLGRPLWSSTVNGRSDMFLSAPVTWNLCDRGGRRVPRGIYLYRATITADGGQTYDTASRKLAVTAR